MEDSRELMLIFQNDAAEHDAGRCYRMTQRISPRVMIVSTTHDATAEEAKRITGAEAVLEPGDALRADLRKTLTDAETLFVDAYAERSRAKKRPGEGLDWDADGFTPPDRPPKR